MAQQVTRWGITGAGRISGSFTNGLKMLPPNKHKVVAVGSRSLDRGNKFAEKYDILKVYGSYEELAANKDIDVVYLGVIHPQHHPLTTLFLEAGHNVLCEKPLTVNARQTRDLVSLARKKNLFLMEGFWSRFFPAYQELRNELAAKSIGDVKLLTATFGLPYMGRGWYKDRETGAGALLAMGSYCTQLAQFVYNHETPVSIVASGILNEDQGSDEQVTSTLTYSGGCMATFTNSMVSKLDNFATVYGTSGNIKLPELWAPVKIITPKGESSFPIQESPIPAQHLRPEGFIYQAEAVRECLVNGLKQHPLMTWDNSIQIAEILDEIRRQIGLVYPEDLS